MVKEATAIVTATPKHIESVRKKIEEIKKSISGRFFDLGELLKEIRDGGYHMTWGFSNFGEWLDTSGLDLKERSAYYLIKIIEMGSELNIPREKLEQVKISKLREIASLDTKRDGKKIKKLIDACVPDKEGNEMSLDDVRQNVAKVKAGDEAIETYVFMTIKISKTAKENVFDPAIELARAEHGDTIDGEGNAAEITPARAIELILADYLAGAENAPEKAEEPLPVEGQKCLAAAPEFADFDELNGPPVLDEVTTQLEAAIPDAEVVDVLIEGPIKLVPGQDPDPTTTMRVAVTKEFSSELNEAEVAKTAEILKTGPAATGHVLNLDVEEIQKRVAQDIATPAPETLSAVDAAVADCRARIAATNAQIDGSQEEDDPLLDDAVKILKQNPGATPNALKLTFRIGELRAFKLYKQAKGKL